MTANQPDVVAVDKHQKKAIVIDVATPNSKNIRKKEHKKLEKYQGLKEDLQKMWKMKATAVPVIRRGLQAGRVTPVDPENNIRDLYLEERRPRNYKITYIHKVLYNSQ